MRNPIVLVVAFFAYGASYTFAGQFLGLNLFRDIPGKPTKMHVCSNATCCCKPDIFKCRPEPIYCRPECVCECKKYCVRPLYGRQAQR